MASSSPPSSAPGVSHVFRLAAADDATVVELLGTFGSHISEYWTPIPMAKAEDGKYEATVDGLTPDTLYTYKFKVDGKWVVDPNAETAADDNAGITNNVFTTPSIGAPAPEVHEQASADSSSPLPANDAAAPPPASDDATSPASSAIAPAKVDNPEIAASPAVIATGEEEPSPSAQDATTAVDDAEVPVSQPADDDDEEEAAVPAHPVAADTREPEPVTEIEAAKEEDAQQDDSVPAAEPAAATTESPVANIAEEKAANVERLPTPEVVAVSEPSAVPVAAAEEAVVPDVAQDNNSPSTDAAVSAEEVSPVVEESAPAVAAEEAAPVTEEKAEPAASEEVMPAAPVEVVP
ncbi:hypothetical protein GGF44_005763, partial [Coemansia sp. RSA 1694]